MSWKLTKKLKDTHLAPFADTFTRSSASTTVGGSPQLKPSISGSILNDLKGPNSIENVNPPQPSTKPGILIVTLHEGRGFSLPPGSEKLFNVPRYGSSHSTGGDYNSSNRPESRGQIAGSYASGRPHSSTNAINNAPTVNGRRYSSKYLPYALLDFDKQQVFINAVSGTPENPVWAGNNTQYKFDVSRATDLFLSLYIRNLTAAPKVGRSEDIFIGTVTVKPRFEEVRAYNDAGKNKNKGGEQEDSFGQPGTEWLDISYGTGKIGVGVEFVEARQQSLSIDDFELLKVVGRGSYGKVLQVRKRDTGRIYALKTIRKANIISRSEVAHTLAERSVLAQINNPFIVPLKFSFQSPEKLYFVLAFVNGGELFYHLKKEQTFSVNRARFYTAELLCALECLHGFNVIYRDLKPENILLDYTGHIALCDFGLCKLNMGEGERTNTFCGTPEYLAPELLLNGGYDKTVDWWTLGVLLYEMLTGLPPYYDENTNEMYRKILHEPLHFHLVPPAARDLLARLLDRDPKRRLGVNEAAEIKAHYFFHGIDWRKLLDRKYEPSFKPNVTDARDTANFDDEFTSEPPTDSYVAGPMLSQTMQQQFAGWSYNRPVAGLGDAGGSVTDPSFEESVQ
ncbi:Pkinase-domain-containing protein [Trematosphaeria pertusa]|uniref:non-specific serine/threonine protein kinase n=1 Tax=Trematosphaeria pertusa TaxID=390896 RepID=A0A6A6HU43_9PLEO|nr:Pkinase-domain-containing protein [Trematosphaeria pertusa]KAF2241439.1 Pkinase-domain-containing protein [Trematosphaeria pertusa]